MRFQRLIISALAVSSAGCTQDTNGDGIEESCVFVPCRATDTGGDRDGNLWDLEIGATTTTEHDGELIVARGGTLQVSASDRDAPPITVFVQDDSTDVLAPVSSQELAGSVLATFRGLVEGRGRILIESEQSVPLDVEVRAADRLVLRGFNDQAVPESAAIAFLDDMHQMQIHLLSADGGRLVDASLIVRGDVSGQFGQYRWDYIELPRLAGTYPMRIRSDALGMIVQDLVIVAAVDQIVSEEAIPSTPGRRRVCFQGLAGERIVLGHGWTLDASFEVDVVSRNCIEYAHVPPGGGTIKVKFGGAETAYTVNQ